MVRLRRISVFLVLMAVVVMALGSTALAKPPLQIQTTTLAAGEVAVTYSQTVVATGGDKPYLWQVSDGSLPSGLLLDPVTGTIGGTPDTPGVFEFVVQVSDSHHAPRTDDQALSITISPAPLVVTTEALPDGQRGAPYDALLEATGGVAPLAWSVIDGALPEGLSLDASTGEISGTPSAEGTATFTVQAVDSYTPAATATKAFSVAVTFEPLTIVTTTLPDGKAGASYSATLETSGGIAPVMWSVSEGSVPDGLSLDAATGEISGAPAAYGVATFTVLATDSDTPANTAAQPLSIAVAPADLSIATTALPDGQLGSAYSQTLAAAGGAAPYAWSVVDGTLPDGLSLDASTGEISGMPAAYGLVTFTVQVSDSWPAANTAAQVLSINVSPSNLAITTTSLPAAPGGAEYSQTLTATGGAEPYTWSISEGSLPTGLSLDAATGAIAGTPTVGGAFAFTAMVTDSWSPANTAVAALSISVSAGPTYQFVASDAEFSTTSTTYVKKVGLTFTPPTVDDWVIFGFCEFKCPNVNYATFVQLFIDGVGEGQNTRKPVDPSDYLPFITVKVKSLSPEAHTVNLMYRAGDPSAAAYVRNARICAVRKADLELWSASRDSGAPLVATLQDIVSLTWTPAVTGSYLVISTAEVNATTAVSTDVQTIYNDTVNDEGITRAADKGDFTTFMSFNYIANAAAGVPVTQKIAARKAAADPADHYVRRARILAIRLTGGRFKYAASAYGIEQNTKATTLQQALSTSWTYGVSGNWLFLNGARVANASTSCQTEVLAQINDSPAGICGRQLMKPKDVSDLLNFSSIDVRNLTASPRKMDMDFRTTSGTGTAKVKRLRFYGLPLDAQ